MDSMQHQIETAISRMSEASRSGAIPDIDEVLAEFQQLRGHAEAVAEIVVAHARLRQAEGQGVDLQQYERLLGGAQEARELLSRRLGSNVPEAHDELTARSQANEETAIQATSAYAGAPTQDGAADPTRAASPAGGQQDAPSPAPEQFGGRYLVQRELAAGAFGVVYLAFDRELQRQVAIKAPRSQHAATTAEALRTEARKLASLSHPHLVAVHDFGVQDDRPYLVTEYLAGSTLRDRLRSGAIDRPAATEAVRQVCEALHSVHRQGFVHRDVKPENILFDHQQFCRLADFGLALLEDEQGERRGEIAGTLRYMSPEQAAGASHHLDGRTDLWAVGVILYEIWSGRPPFRETEPHELLEQIRHRPVKPLAMVCDVPSALNEIVMRCLHRDPQHRYASAREVADELGRFLRGEAPPAPVAGGPSWWRKSGWILATALLLVGVIAAFASIPFGSGGDNPVASGTTVSPDPVNESPSPNPSPPAQPPLAALSGTIQITLYNGEVPGRSGVDLADAFPLREGDSIRLDASLNRKAYLYLFWITDQGVLPVYPGQAGDWDSLFTAQASPQSAVSLPEARDEGWPMEASPNMETILLLADDRPLDVARIRQLLEDYPTPRKAKAHAVLDLNAAPMTLMRAPVFESEKLEDEVLQARAYLHEKLEPQVKLMRAIGFFNPPAERGPGILGRRRRAQD